MIITGSLSQSCLGRGCDRSVTGRPAWIQTTITCCICWYRLLFYFRSERDLSRQAVHLPLIAAMLADHVGELSQEILLIMLDS